MTNCTKKSLMKNRLIILACILFLFSCTADKTSDERRQKKVFDFRLEDTHHQRFYLNQHEGKIVVIVFWATWCIVCKKYLNELEKITPEFKEKEIELVSIVVDPENGDALRELLKTYIHVSYPVLLDRERSIMEKFKVREIPTTIIIGRASTIVMQKSGFDLSTISQIRNRLNLVLENEP